MGDARYGDRQGQEEQRHAYPQGSLAVGDGKTIQKRLERTRRRARYGYRGEPEALAAAARYYGLDPKDPRQRETLLYALADALFESRKRGRPKDSATAWDGRRLVTLGEIYVKKKKQYPRLSDAKIAKLIKAEHDEFKNDDAEQIRQRLRKAHLGYELYWEKKREDYYSDLADNQDDYDDD
jgi:hypothetical protein